MCFLCVCGACECPFVAREADVGVSADACFAPEEASRREVICPTGKSKRAAREAPSSPLAKNIPFLDSPKSVLELIPSCSVRGALAIVTDVERDAVDVDALLTNGADADGEGVWS